MDTLAAARVMFSSSATATKYLKWRSSMCFAWLYRDGCACWCYRATDTAVSTCHTWAEWYRLTGSNPPRQ